MKKLVIAIIMIMLIMTGCGNQHHKNEKVLNYGTTGHHEAITDDEVDEVVFEIKNILQSETGHDIDVLGYEFDVERDRIEVCFEDSDTYIRYIEYIGR